MVFGGDFAGFGVMCWCFGRLVGLVLVVCFVWVLLRCFVVDVWCVLVL